MGSQFGRCEFKTVSLSRLVPAEEQTGDISKEYVHPIRRTEMKEDYQEPRGMALEKHDPCIVYSRQSARV